VAIAGMNRAAAVNRRCFMVNLVKKVLGLTAPNAARDQLAEAWSQTRKTPAWPR